MVLSQTLKDKIFSNISGEELILRAELILLLIFYYVLISSDLHSRSQIIIAYSIILFIFAYTQFSKKKPLWLQTFFVLLGLFLSLRYIHWRITVSIHFSGLFDFLGMILLFAAELHSLAIYILGVFTSLSPLERKVIDLSTKRPEELPTVDVFIPTYSEPVEIVTNTVLAALSMDYPKNRFKVYVLDDGGTDQKCNDPNMASRQKTLERRQQLEKMVEKTGANYLTRPYNIHAKAGNLNEALQKTSGEVILILDSDHIPTREFLKNTVGWFIEDENMFLVQTPHTFYNPDPIERNMRMFGLAPGENQMFYQYIQKGHDFWESSFFCGSGAVMRRKYLEDIGGIAGETITEDAETALLLHARGHKSAYIAIPMIRGRNPDTFSGMVLQRIRWTQGMIQIFLLRNPLTLKGLKWYQRLSYMSASGFWFFAFSRVVFMIAPLFYLYFGLHIYRADAMDLLGFTIPHVIAANQVSRMLYSRVRWSLFSEVYETAISFFTLPAIIEVLLKPRAAQFKVTPKGEDITRDFISHLISPFLIIFILILIGYLFGIYRWIILPNERYIVLMTLAWNTFNLVLILTCLAIASEKGEKRQYARIPSKERCQIEVGGVSFQGRIQDVSEGGAAVELVGTYSSRDSSIHLNKDAKFTIFDSQNQVTVFNANILRCTENKIILRFIGLEDDLELRKKLVVILYGSDTRWKNLDEREDSPSLINSMVLLVQHSLDNIMFADIFRQVYNNLVRRIKYGA